MADTQSSHLKLTIQTPGGNNNTWGVIENVNLTTIDSKFGSVTSISTTGGNTSLSGSQEIVNAISVTGTLSSHATITFSGRGGSWIIENATTGDYSVTAKVSGQPGVAITQGSTCLIFCDGTDITYGNPPPAETAEITVASAATTDILGAASEFVAISGTTTITSFGTGINRRRFVRADGDFKIVHNGTALTLPGGKNIVAKSGDTFVVASDSSSNAMVYLYQRGSAPPPALPIGTVVPFAGASAPSGWLLCYGQDISRSTYEVLFDTIGVTYGIGNGSTTFTLPDMRGRVVAGQDDMGGTSANRLTGQSGGLDGDTLGAVGGAETHQLATAELPSHSHTGSSLTISYGGGHTHAYYYTTGQIYSGGTVGNVVAGSGSSYSTGYAGDHSHSVSGSTGNTGSGNSHNNVQPTIILNYIIFAGA